MSLNPSSSLFATPPVDSAFDQNAYELALAIPEVAMTISRHDDGGYDSLCALRLVCKSWKRAFDPMWKFYRRPFQVSDSFFFYLRQRCRPNIDGGQAYLSNFMEDSDEAIIHNRDHPMPCYVSDCKWALKHGDFPKLVDFMPRPKRFIYLQNVAVLFMTNGSIPVVNEKFDSEFETALPNLERLTITSCVLTCRRPVLMARPVLLLPEGLNVEQKPGWGKLKYVSFKNVGFVEHPELRTQTCQGKLVLAYPNLSEVSVRIQSKNSYFTFETFGTSEQNNVWVLESPKIYDDRIPTDWNWEEEFPTARLSVYSDLQKEGTALQGKNKYLDRLFVYHPKNHASTLGFTGPCENVTKLCLVGGFSENLDFLKWFPKLTEFRWNSHRDNSLSGKHCPEENQWQAVDCIDIIQNTSGLAEGFKSENLQSLELEWTFGSLECWKKLRSWMPRVTSLKCTVLGDTQLDRIGKLWPEIEELELGHGSRASSNAIEQFVVDNFHLQTITWHPCSCTPNTDKMNPGRLAWMALKASPGVVLPW